MKIVEDQEPDRLRAELYRLNHENKKLLKAKEDIKLTKAEYADLKAQDTFLAGEMSDMRADQENLKNEA